MDAFSLALIYGTYDIGYKNEIILSVIVGLFHFMMPLVGFCFGNLMMMYFIFNVNVIVGIIFIVIGSQMILSSIREEEVRILLSLVGFLFFGLSVSVDSLTVGIGIRAISDNYFLVSFMFMICSGLFTYLGLQLGRQLSLSLGKTATIFGGIILIVLGISYVF